MKVPDEGNAVDCKASHPQHTVALAECLLRLLQMLKHSRANCAVERAIFNGNAICRAKQIHSRFVMKGVKVVDADVLRYERPKHLAIRLFPATDIDQSLLQI